MTEVFTNSRLTVQSLSLHLLLNLLTTFTLYYIVSPLHFHSIPIPYTCTSHHELHFLPVLAEDAPFPHVQPFPSFPSHLSPSPSVPCEVVRISIRQIA